MEQGRMASALRSSSLPTNIDEDTIIDIHDISVILNYERGAMEPRFRHTKLLEVATTQEFQSALVTVPEWKQADPNHRTGMIFDTVPEEYQTDEPDLPSNMTHWGPTPSVRNLTLRQLEMYYWQARNHDACFRTVTLLQHFFNLFPFETPIRIRTHAPVSGRIKGDKSAKQKTVEYITMAYWRQIVEFHITHSKHISTTFVLPRTRGYFTGGPRTPHAVIGFSPPGQNIDTILDLSSLQYGEVGRGYKDADYFRFEPIQDYVSLTLPKYGESNTIETAKLSDVIGPAADDEYLIEVARRAKQRWENRKRIPFCAYCGGPPTEARQLFRCSGCKVQFYCGSEHQRNAWPLHKLFCGPTTTNPS